jgi:cytochrome c peroxidase
MLLLSSKFKSRGGVYGTTRQIWLICFAVLFIGVACTNEDDVTPQPGGGTYLLRFPSYFPQPEPLLSNNDPLTNYGVLLGEKLFFDPILSGNNQISCGTCHQPKKGFADGVALATHGISGNPLHRHSPALINLAWAKGFFWDGGSKNLESQAFAPITHPDEMHQDRTILADELKVIAEYVTLFSKTFPDKEITNENIAKALAQYQRTLISATTKYDDYRQGKYTLTELELKGMTIVEQKCGSCHTAPLFTNNGYHNNGLDSEYSDEHEGIALGRYRITHLLQDMGKFKVPTLRNVTASAPYMHDGRFATLNDVLEHYSQGIQSSTTLDAHIPEQGMLLTTDEREAILAFLNALTDEEFMNTHQQPD